DIIHWNNGVWDTMRLYGDGTFTTLEDYKKTILRMAKIMTEYYGKKVIFATTTPVDDRYPYSKNEDILKFNAAVVPELEKMGVIINDLHSFVAPHVDEYIKEGDFIHLSEKGIDACAKPSDAASLGAFDLASLCFDRPALNKAGVNCDLLPTVQKDGFVGKTAEGIPVTVAIGDNQAAVYGALGNQAGVSVNVGTGSQVSVPLAALPEQAECEIRPYLFGAYLGVDCPLCGGRSYALLRDFFAQTLAAFGAETSGDLYTPLNALLEKGEEKYLSSAPCFTPLFCGTRTSPKSRATIEGISDKNFTPEAFAFALVEGMAQELWEGYEKIAGGLSVAHLAASGNGIRKNPVLARALQRKFGAPLTLPEGKEEAAFGAAKYAFALKENAFALCEKNPNAANAL
ncbi:MAG: hypothetical protein II368_02025, partial [Clostridia bacterium]|nr:hypothetical protein [Clostridia bacterium]